MRLIIKLILLLCLGFNTFANTLCEAQQKHVIFIGIDGVRRDAFNQAYENIKQKHLAPHFTYLVENGALDNKIYAGGSLQTDRTTQATLSEPGWVTLLTGTWAYHHHIHFNSDLERNDYNHHFPTIYNYIKHLNPMATTASFTDWQPMQLLSSFKFYGNDAADINKFFPIAKHESALIADDTMTNALVDTIKQPIPPTFIFTHYMEPDDSGHHSGFSPNNLKYMHALTQELFNVDKLAEAIQESETAGNKWLVIITTDHGGHAIIHGSQDAQDRDIFALFYAKDTVFSGGIQLPIARGQVIFVPQILSFLNLNSCLETLDGHGLL